MMDDAVAVADPNSAGPFSDPGFGDAVASEAAQNDFLRARAATLDDGLFRLQGGEAVAAAPAAESGLQDLRDALLDRTGSARQRASTRRGALGRVWRSAIDAALTQGQYGAALDLHENAQDQLTPHDGAALAPEMASAPDADGPGLC